MKIQFDDDDFGGFTVVEGKLTEVPYGWEEVSPGRFEPKWPQCRYRRLSKLSRHGRVTILPQCLLYQNAVVFDQCVDCQQAKPPLEYLTMTPEIQAALQSENPDMLRQFVAETDPVFNPPPTKKNVDPWVACKHRIEVPTDCCTKHKCQNEQCPLFNKFVKKRNCRGCKFRE